MSIVRITVAALAVWRLTHLIHSEDGPFGVFGMVRGWLRRLSLSGFVDCFLCLSIWVAAPFGFMLGGSFAEIVMLILAFSAITILIDRSTGFSERGDLSLEQPHRERMELWFAESDHQDFEERERVAGTLRRSA